MHIPRPRLPRRSARLRLTIQYGAAFLACGAAVLAITGFLFYENTTPHLSSSQPTASAQAVLGVGVPSTTVKQAGGYDIIPLKIPAADVRHVGNHDVVDLSMPAAVPKQTKESPGLTAAEQAKLLAEVGHQVHYDEWLVLIACAILLVVIAVAAGYIGWIIAGRVLRPLSSITSAARRIAASSLDERLALQGPDDELKELADTLDNLFARLETSFDAQRRFAANASHELRTPLTRERALLQVTLADPASTTSTWEAVSQELLASNAEQERLIEALLTLASSEGGTGERDRLDLAVIASEALTTARPAADGLGLDVHAELQPAVLDGDPLLVHQLVTNLIDNAVGHNTPGGNIQITTRTSHDGAVVSVTNSGQVIPPAEVDRLFQPFQRFGPRTARRDGGHGLGLSIVRAITIAHGATVVAHARSEGGLTIDVTFPPPAHGPRAAGQIRAGGRPAGVPL
jgi:signal transduction histidine kinase